MSSDRPLILSVDTSTSASSVALTAGGIQDGELVASVSLNGKITHSRRLLASIDWLLSESGVEICDVDGIGVGLGPGSFTGLRIGMATVKGLAMAAVKPLLGVATLDALALNCSTEKRVCVVLDARKKEVYTAWYQTDASGVMRRQTEIRAVAPDKLAAEIKEPVVMVGDGLLTYGEMFRDELGEWLTCAPVSLHYPSAVAIGLLSAEKFVRGDVLDLDSAAPRYVRASDAELSLGKKRNREDDS